MSKKKTVSLILGSGGARGYTHIGIIHELERQGYDIKSISGSSMGALIGGLYACGKLKEYEEWIENFDLMDILKLVDFSFGSNGMIKGDKVFMEIENIIGDINIEDLPISFTAVATDVEKSKEVWLQKGSLKDAIRASIAIPTIFTPKEINGKILFDGGILNPVPVLPTLSDFSDLLIAVDLNYDAPVPAEYQDILKIKKSYLNRKVSRFLETNFFTDSAELNYFSIVNRSIETMQGLISRYQLASHRPDIMINISTDVCDFYDFHKSKELITYGERIAKDSLI
ncbi:MAG: patatin-like phospholipase family protein [Sulfurovum sp.]|nr:patatin-like phospholipase family protein [Sulfurovaceae bacterium]